MLRYNVRTMILLGAIILLLILLLLDRFLPDMAPTARGRDMRAVLRNEPLPEDYDDYMGTGGRISR
jgi:hypothetical protein